MSSRKSKDTSTSEPSSSGSFPPLGPPPPRTSTVPGINLTHGRYQQDVTALDRTTPRHIPPIAASPPRRSGMAVADMINPESPSSPVGNISTTSSSALASPAPDHPDTSFVASRAVTSSPQQTRSEYTVTSRSIHRQQDPSAQAESSQRSPSGQMTLLQGSRLGAISLTDGELSQRDRDRMKLKIRQQPRAARACGLGERDRRVIDPPPILQLCLDGYDPSSAADKTILRSPFNMVSCNLIAVGDEGPHQPGQDVSMVVDPSDPSKEMRRLMGQLTISPFITEDLHTEGGVSDNDRTGSYYIFSDLSCRQNGRYKLRFTLLPFDVTSTSIGERTSTAAVIESGEFTVYSAKDFPGMQQSSELTKKLKSLGAAVPIKKGNESRKKGSKKRASESEGSDNDM